MTEVTFPQLVQRACGIDVHLKVVVATIDGVGIQRETRSLPAHSKPSRVL